MDARKKLAENVNKADLQEKMEAFLKPRATSPGQHGQDPDRRLQMTDVQCLREPVFVDLGRCR